MHEALHPPSSNRVTAQTVSFEKHSSLYYSISYAAHCVRLLSRLPFPPECAEATHKSSLSLWRIAFLRSFVCWIGEIYGLSSPTAYWSRSIGSNSLNSRGPLRLFPAPGPLPHSKRSVSPKRRFLISYSSQLSDHTIPFLRPCSSHSDPLPRPTDKRALLSDASPHYRTLQTAQLTVSSDCNTLPPRRTQALRRLVQLIASIGLRRCIIDL